MDGCPAGRRADTRTALTTFAGSRPTLLGRSRDVRGECVQRRSLLDTPELLPELPAPTRNEPGAGSFHADHPAWSTHPHQGVRVAFMFTPEYAVYARTPM